MVNSRTIAIDGPVASGKSTVGSLVASQLSWQFVDTGLMYRAVAWLMSKEAIKQTNLDKIKTILDKHQIETICDNEKTTITIDGDIVNDYLSDPSVIKTVSEFSTIPYIRTYLVKKQRNLSEISSTVMAGRDIGTVVLPNASTKIFLQAGIKTRTTRKLSILEQNDEESQKSITNEISHRDKIDSNREISPLKAASDSFVIHTDNMNLKQVVNTIIDLNSYNK